MKILSLVACVFILGFAFAESLPPTPQVPPAFSETWSSGKIDSAKWYALRKQWGNGNHGVVPENVRIEKDRVGKKERFVLRCEAHGDRYDGPITGQWKQKTRVGGVLVSKPFFASGRFEVIMKLGDSEAFEGSPQDPMIPAGTVPAIWTYAYRLIRVPPEKSDNFNPNQPLYHPYIQNWGKGMAFYWSELDFPEFGKNGRFDQTMYNTFLNKRHHPQMIKIPKVTDGKYHLYTSIWETETVPLPGVKDDQVKEAEGYWWVQSKDVPFHKYEAMPLLRKGPDDYEVYRGKRVRHWIDGTYIGENTKWVPCMAAQLNLGIWLPDWAGPAAWKTSCVRFAAIRIWQSNDPGDVTGILVEDIGDNF